MKRNTHGSEVAAEVARLRGASDDQLRAYDAERATKRIAWLRTKCDTKRSDDLLDTAYRVLLIKLGIKEEEAPIVQRDKNAIVFRSKNFCPTLEACRILGLDTRKVCELYTERSADALVREVDPRLSFRRDYEKIRPHSEYCEESIWYRDDSLNGESENG